MSSSEIYQSPVALVLRRLVALLGVLVAVAGIVYAVVNPVDYLGWVWGTVGLVMVVLVLRQRQLTKDGLVLRRTSLRAKD